MAAHRTKNTVRGCASCGGPKPRGRGRLYCDACVPTVAQRRQRHREATGTARQPCRRCGGLKPPGRRRHHCDECAGIAATERRAHRRLAERGLAIEHIDRLVVLEMTDGACGICGEDVDPTDWQMDHVWPLALGGQHAYHNLQPAHPLCNLRKGANFQGAIGGD